MTVLILGANGSRKSAYAEKLTARLSVGRLFYIATMIPYGEEGQARVEKHREQRKSVGFITVEKSVNISEVSFPTNTVVLLEDVSNLLGNALFAGGCHGDENGVFADIRAMCEKCRDAVLVSIDGLTAKSEYNGETNSYIDSLNRLNGRLSDFADVVITMRSGEPIFTKGEANAFD